MTKLAHYDTIVSPVVTEKSTLQGEHNKVTFKVSVTATKPEIKGAVESLFNVKVDKVNVINGKGKTKRFRGREGKQSDYKKAVVTLAEGSRIEDLGTGV